MMTPPRRPVSASPVSRVRPLLLAAALLSAPRASRAAALAGSEPGGPTELAREAGPVAVGEPMVTFGGPALDGSSFGLTRFQRRERPDALLVALFGTWCHACATRLPELARVAAEFRARGVRLVLVDVEGPTPPGLGAWLDRHGVDATAPDLAVVLDPFEAIAVRRLAVKTLPRAYVVDRKGLVTAIVTHEGDDLGAVLSRELERALAPAPRRDPRSRFDGAHERPPRA